MTNKRKRTALPHKQFETKSNSEWVGDNEIKDCLLRILEELTQLSERPEASVEECCTGGATDSTELCFDVGAQFLQGEDADCRYTWGGVDLPNPYSRADVLAALPSGAVIQTHPSGKADLVQICASAEARMIYGSRCFREGGPVAGTFSRVAFTGSPNTEGPRCAARLNVVGKLDQEILEALKINNALAEKLLVKICSLVDGPCPGCGSETEEVFDKV